MGQKNKNTVISNCFHVCSFRFYFHKVHCGLHSNLFCPNTVTKLDMANEKEPTCVISKARAA